MKPMKGGEHMLMLQGVNTKQEVDALKTDDSVVMWRFPTEQSTVRKISRCWTNQLVMWVAEPRIRCVQHPISSEIPIRAGGLLAAGREARMLADRAAGRSPIRIGSSTGTSPVLGRQSASLFHLLQVLRQKSGHVFESRYIGGVDFHQDLVGFQAGA
jgi:hypothetical protein